MSITRDGSTCHRVFNGTDVWISGYNTDAVDDNVFSQTGSGSMTRPDGVSVSRTITTPLIIDRGCGFITEGVIEMQCPHGTVSINFGNGACDDQATVTKPNGQTETITLHHG
jgi:hypothetical protein